MSRDEAIYKDRGGRLYYRDELEENKYGDIIIYDRYDREEVILKHYRDRENTNNSTSNSRPVTYDVGDVGYRPSPLAKKETPKETVVVERNYDDLRMFTPSINTVSIKGLYNTLMESMDEAVGTHISALYPHTGIKKYTEDLEKVKSFLSKLIVKPSLTLDESLTEEGNKFICRLINMSFKDVEIVDVAHLTNLMEVNGATDEGWKILAGKINKAIEGKVETNIYILPKEFYCIVELMKNTDAYTIPKGIKEKLNIPYSGYIRIGELVLSINGNHVRLFMVIP